MTDHRCFTRLAGAVAAIMVAAIMTVATLANAQAPAAQGADEARENPVLVELFLSQACNMCPPAAALFPEIAARKDVVALAWHVDYWNITDSAQGRWEDPYSSRAFTDRQKRYNINIRNRSSIYTPQIVVDGAQQTVGANLEKIGALINSTNRQSTPVAVSAEDSAIRFSVGESAEGGNAYLVTFKPTAKTRITGGANAGKVFDEVNVVTSIRPLGLVRRKGAELIAPAPAAGENCALVVQEPQQKRVIAAAYCAS